MKRKGMGKGTGKGYKNMTGVDPRVHSDSARGRKQPQSIPVARVQEKVISTDEEKEFIETFGKDTLKDFLKETDSKIESVREDESGILSIEMEDGSEYIVFEDEEKAESQAEDRVREDLEENPEMFTSSWLENYVTISDTDRNIIAGEEADNIYEDMSDTELLEESGLQEEWDELQETIDEKEDKYDNLINADRDIEAEETRTVITDLETKQEDLVETAKEDLVEAKTDEIEEALKDPINYFVEEQGMYSREDLLKQSFISIDIDEATEDAINTDGWQHFLATYDGNSIDLADDRVAIRVN